MPPAMPLRSVSGLAQREAWWTFLVAAMLPSERHFSGSSLLPRYLHLHGRRELKAIYCFKIPNFFFFIFVLNKAPKTLIKCISFPLLSIYINSFKAADEKRLKTPCKLSLGKLFDYYLLSSVMVYRKHVSSTLFSQSLLICVQSI